jgi:hypothetical protein
MKKLISTIALGTALVVVPTISNATTLNTTSALLNDGILQNFTSIDWNANGAGWVQGFNLTSSTIGPNGINAIGATDTFTFKYQAFAGSIGTTTPTPNLYVSSPGPQSGGYELTTFFNLNETATCLTANCDTINIATNNGTFNIYFDNTPGVTGANQAAGTGFTNGVNIISGNWTGGNSVFSSNGAPIGPGAFGSGTANLVGTVLVTNNAYINPNLLNTNFQASILFPGQGAPTYTRPSAFNGVATGADTNTDFVLQADGSQPFTSTSVPEPTALILLGAGALGFGLRKKHATI